jgi:catalase
MDCSTVVGAGIEVPSHHNLTRDIQIIPKITTIAADAQSNGELVRDYVEDRNTKAQDAFHCMSNGAPYPHLYGTQRVGENGPLLLQDFHLIVLLSHFDRERNPERVVHAKGSAARGYYKTTDPMDDLSIADIFQAGKECPISIRSSTVGGEQGSTIVPAILEGSPLSSEPRRLIGIW